MHPIVGLASHPVVIARLQAAYATWPGIRWAASTADVYRACAGGARMVVIDSCARSEDPPTSLPVLVATLRARFPQLPIVAYWDAAAGGAGTLLPLARAGVSEVVTLDVDDGRQRLVDLLDATGRHGLATSVLARLAAAGVPADALAIVRAMLQYSHRPIPVCEIARALGVSRRTVLSRLDAAGLPNPSRLAAWCRVLSAGHLIAGTGRTIESIAADLDFPSGNALRNLIRRHAGLEPTALRRAGGLERVLEHFVAVLLGDRERPRARLHEEPVLVHAVVPGPERAGVSAAGERPRRGDVQPVDRRAREAANA
jgi:AraC-like DNA-binding protein